MFSRRHREILEPHTITAMHNQRTRIGSGRLGEQDKRKQHGGEPQEVNLHFCLCARRSSRGTKQDSGALSQVGKLKMLIRVRLGGCFLVLVQ